MRKAAIAVLALALIITFSAVSVMAMPTERQRVSVKEYITASYGELPPTRNWTTKGGIFQMRGNQEFYALKLIIGDPAQAEYDFNHTLVGYGSWNTKTGVFVGHFKGTWTLIDDVSSGFSGNMEMRAFDFNPVAGNWSSWSAHEVAQGFGDFAGQTLKLSIHGPLDWTAPFTGYLLNG